jgi:hypothetical protein
MYQPTPRSETEHGEACISSLIKKGMKLDKRAALERGMLPCGPCGFDRPICEFYIYKGSLPSCCKVCHQDRVVARAYQFPSIEALRGFREEHGNRCAICGTTEDATGKRLAVDHDHSCCPNPGKGCQKCIRGLLCIRCNSAVGSLKRRPRAIRRSAGLPEENHMLFQDSGT